MLVRLLLLLFLFAPFAMAQSPNAPLTLVVHGGAGTILRQNLSSAREAAYHAALRTALDSGYAVLERGGTSLEAVETAVRFLEDSPLFNAGKGAVFTAEGHHELDAAIMDGATGQAGAVAGLTTVRNPITAARAVMTQSPHVLLIGPGAEQFARDQGLEMVAPDYFRTDERYQQWQRARRADSIRLDHSDPQGHLDPPGDRKFGTVGAVALDRYGHLAAATSTGGMTNKRYGRVGDVPLIGAGTYADDATCAVSATGHGEYFIRAVVAHDIAARMAYQGVSLREAADAVVMKKLVEQGGEGGVIAVDRQGHYAMPFNSSGMYRGVRQQGRPAQTAIFPTP